MSDDSSSCDLPSTHKCCPPTAMWRNFCLLRFRPGPVRSLLSNLVHRNFHLDDHVDTLLRVDTRSTQSDRPQVAPNSRRSEAQPPGSWITSACHYTRLIEIRMTSDGLYSPLLLNHKWLPLKQKIASTGNRTRIYCLGSNNANHYTTNAFTKGHSLLTSIDP